MRGIKNDSSTSSLSNRENSGTTCWWGMTGQKPWEEPRREAVVIRSSVMDILRGWCILDIWMEIAFMELKVGMCRELVRSQSEKSKCMVLEARTVNVTTHWVGTHWDPVSPGVQDEEKECKGYWERQAHEIKRNWGRVVTWTPRGESISEGESG